MGPCPHCNLQDADCNAIVDRVKNSAMAGELGHNWGRGERSFDHG